MIAEIWYHVKQRNGGENVEELSGYKRGVETAGRSSDFMV
jgi:hypothetical protein